jgi:tetratricopeptide (TPR) repeat protein
MLMLWFTHPDEPIKARLHRVLPAAFLAIPLAEYFVLRHFALASTVQSTAPMLGVDAGRDLVSRFLYSVAALREYARMMVWPHPLRVSYENFTGDGLLAAALVHALLLAAAVALRRRAPLVTFAIAFFYVALFPSTRLFTSSGVSLKIGDFVLLKPQSGLVLVAERVAYLPSVALAIGAGAGLAELARRCGARAATACAAAVIAAGALLTFARNMDWHSAPTLFAAEVKAAPANGDGWRLYVSALSGAGRYEEAATACDSQLDQDGRSGQLLNNCGVVYDKLQRDEFAIRAYRRAIDVGLAPVGHANLGRVYARLGRAAEAEAEFVAAAAAETNPAQRHYRTGMMLARFHPERLSEARSEFEAALAIQPDFAAAKKALAELPR